MTLMFARSPAASSERSDRKGVTGKAITPWSDLRSASGVMANDSTFPQTFCVSVSPLWHNLVISRSIALARRPMWRRFRLEE